MDNRFYRGKNGCPGDARLHLTSLDLREKTIACTVFQLKAGDMLANHWIFRTHCLYLLKCELGINVKVIDNNTICKKLKINSHVTDHLKKRWLKKKKNYCCIMYMANSKNWIRHTPDQCCRNQNRIQTYGRVSRQHDPNEFDDQSRSNIYNMYIWTVNTS